MLSVYPCGAVFYCLMLPAGSSTIDAFKRLLVAETRCYYPSPSHSKCLCKQCSTQRSRSAALQLVPAKVWP